jgi:Uma2 family endonuclease
MHQKLLRIQSGIMTAMPHVRHRPPARSRTPKKPEPTWDLISFFPAQGEWTEQAYLALERRLDTHRLIELVDGRIEVLPVPTEEHQAIIGFLYEALVAIVRPMQLGRVFFAGLRVRMRTLNFREPDIVFLLKKNEHKRGNVFWRGADLAMEVVSADDPDRDYVDKRLEYARAGIREYWIVDPRKRFITLLRLSKKAYVEHGVFRDGDQVTSLLLPAFSVNVTDVFDSAKE